jgi:hypothetical protein
MKDTVSGGAWLVFLEFLEDAVKAIVGFVFVPILEFFGTSKRTPDDIERARRRHDEHTGDADREPGSPSPSG